MKLSDLQQVLTKIQQLAGDVDVILKDAESEAETVITDLSVHLDPSNAQATGKLAIEHGAAPAAEPAEPAADPPAADTENPAGT